MSIGAPADRLLPRLSSGPADPRAALPLPPFQPGRGFRSPFARLTRQVERGEQTGPDGLRCLMVEGMTVAQAVIRAGDTRWRNVGSAHPHERGGRWNILLSGEAPDAILVLHRQRRLRSRHHTPHPRHPPQRRRWNPAVPRRPRMDLAGRTRRARDSGYRPPGGQAGDCRLAEQGPGVSGKPADLCLTLPTRRGGYLALGQA